MSVIEQPSSAIESWENIVDTSGCLGVRIVFKPDAPWEEVFEIIEALRLAGAEVTT